MHREDLDPVQWKMGPEEISMRRRVFWELVSHDRWLALRTSRPASLSSLHFDCKLPIDTSDNADFLATCKYRRANSSWQLNAIAVISIQHKFTNECLVPLLDQTMSKYPPLYSSVHRLGKRILSFTVPEWMETAALNDRQQMDYLKTIQLFSLQNSKDLSLLILHRDLFCCAIMENDGDPALGKYAESVKAMRVTRGRFGNL